SASCMTVGMAALRWCGLPLIPTVASYQPATGSQLERLPLTAAMIRGRVANPVSRRLEARLRAVWPRRVRPCRSRVPGHVAREAHARCPSACADRLDEAAAGT